MFGGFTNAFAENLVADLKKTYFKWKELKEDMIAAITKQAEEIRTPSVNEDKQSYSKLNYR